MGNSKFSELPFLSRPYIFEENGNRRSFVNSFIYLYNTLIKYFTLLNILKESINENVTFHIWFEFIFDDFEYLQNVLSIGIYFIYDYWI